VRKGAKRLRLQEQRHAACLRHTGNKRGFIPCYKPSHGRQRLHTRISHRWARQVSPAEHKGPYPRLDEGCALLRAIPDTLVAGEHYPPTLSHGGEPLHVMRVRWEMIVVHLDLHSRVPKRFRDHVLAKAAVEEKDQGG
jgi:hypothetical protein